MDAPYGPHRIGQNRQVALPADLMKIVRLEPGDQVYVQVNPDLDGTLIVVPVELAARWFYRGREAERASRSEESVAEQPPPGG